MLRRADVLHHLDFRMLGDVRDFLPSLDASRAMRNLDTAAHEWIGSSAIG
jgi:hypothetical protein